MNQETTFFSHFIGNIYNIQDSIVLCGEMYSNPFVGEIVYFNNNNAYKGLVFEISLKNIKILLLDCDQKNLFIGDSIYGSRETIKVVLGTHFFNILKKNVYNSDDVSSSSLKSFYFVQKMIKGRSQLKKKYNIFNSKIFFKSYRKYSTVSKKGTEKEIPIKRLSKEESEIKSSQKYEQLEMITNPEIIKQINELERFQNIENNCIWEQEPSVNYFHSSRFLQFMLFLFYIFFYLFKLVYFTVLWIFFNILLIIYNFSILKTIIYINTKWNDLSDSDPNYNALLHLDGLTFRYKIFVTLLLFIELPLLFFLTLIINLLTLVLTMSCFFFSIFTIPCKWVLGISSTVSFYKYFIKLLMLILIFFIMSFLSILINIYFSNVFWIKYLFFFIFFLVLTCYNYKKKSNKVHFKYSIFHIFLLINDMFRYRLENSLFTCNNVFDDLNHMRWDGGYIYKIYLFFDIFKDYLKSIFFKEKKEDILPKSSMNKKKHVNNQKRYYVKKLIQISNQLGYQSEHVWKKVNSFQTLSKTDAMKNIIGYSKSKGIPVSSLKVEYGSSNNEKIVSVDNCYVDHNNKKIYFHLGMNNGTKQEYFSEINTDTMDQDGIIYFCKQQQLLKIQFDWDHLKLKEYKVFKGLFHFEDVHIGFFDDKPFFDQASHVFDQHMNKHNYFSIPCTCIDQETNQVVLRYFIIVASSDTSSSTWGDLFPKNYAVTYGLKQHQHNMAKPFSTIVDKCRDLSESDFKSVIRIENEFELTSSNKKHGHVAYKFLADQLSKKKILVFSDSITGKKSTFLSTGNYTNFFNNNPSIINKVLGNMKHIDFQLDYLKWYADNEDYIFSMFYAMEENDYIFNSETSLKDVFPLF